MFYRVCGISNIIIHILWEIFRSRDRDNLRERKEYGCLKHITLETYNTGNNLGNRVLQTARGLGFVFLFKLLVVPSIIEQINQVYFIINGCANSFTNTPLTFALWFLCIIDFVIETNQMLERHVIFQSCIDIVVFFISSRSTEIVCIDYWCYNEVDTLCSIYIATRSIHINSIV